MTLFFPFQIFFQKLYIPTFHSAIDVSAIAKLAHKGIEESLLLQSQRACKFVLQHLTAHKPDMSLLEQTILTQELSGTK